MKRATGLLFSVLIVPAFLFAQVASSQESDDSQKCRNSNGDGAIAACTRLLASSQLSRDDKLVAYVSRGNAFSAKGDFDKAILDFNEAITLDPLDDDVLISRGIIWFNRGNYKNAIQDFNLAIHSNPSDAVAYVNRELAWRQIGFTNKVMHDLDEELRANPNSGFGYLDHCRAKFFRSELEPALADCNQAVTLLPKDATAYEYRGLVLFAQAQYALAAKDFEQVSTIRPPEVFAPIRLMLANQHIGKATPVDLYRALDLNATADWPKPLVQFLNGEIPIAQLNAAAKSATPDDQAEEECQARFYSGDWMVLHAQKVKGLEILHAASLQCPKYAPEHILAAEEVKHITP